MLALLVVWLVGCYLVVLEPTVNKPAKVDAILVLGPPDVDGRAEAAYALARAHYASTVVVSVESDLQQQLKGACRNQNPGYQVICFQPEPSTTQGEAREIGRLARERGWTSIMVVTSKYHISRARLILGRCMPGIVLMVAAPGKPSVLTWTHQFFYQSGAYLKAFVRRGC
ncbi:MAG: YdcF family protein [Jatrophihabitans sp.]